MWPFIISPRPIEGCKLFRYHDGRKIKRGSGRTEPNRVRCLCPKHQAIYEQSVPIIVVQFLFGYDFVPVVEYFDTLTWGEGDYLLLVFYEGMLRLDAVRRETQNCWRNLRIDTSGGSVNCSAPFEKGWMCGSL